MGEENQNPRGLKQIKRRSATGGTICHVIILTTTSRNVLTQGTAGVPLLHDHHHRHHRRRRRHPQPVCRTALKASTTWANTPMPKVPSPPFRCRHRRPLPPRKRSPPTPRQRLPLQGSRRRPAPQRPHREHLRPPHLRKAQCPLPRPGAAAPHGVRLARKKKTPRQQKCRAAGAIKRGTIGLAGGEASCSQAPEVIGSNSIRQENSLLRQGAHPLLAGAVCPGILTDEPNQPRPRTPERAPGHYLL